MAAMVKCAVKGCKKLVFPKQGLCWEHKLKARDKKLRRLQK